MIKNISIENFKSIKNLNFEARRVNIFIGEPNTGKSNVLEALGLYSSEYVNNFNDIVRFKNINNIFHQNNSSNPIKIIFDRKWQLSTYLEFEEINLKNRVNVEIGYIDELFILHYSYDSESGQRGSSGDRGLEKYKTYHPKCYQFKVEDKFTSRGLNFLQPPFGKNLYEILVNNVELREVVTGIVEQKGYKLRLDSGSQEIYFEQDDNFFLYPYKTLSDTLQRVIFYLAAMLSNKNSALIFEEPESHIFPFYNQYLAETIGLDEESGNQYFIATHNPYFLGSIAQKTKIEDLAVFITYMENHETKFRQLREDEYPELFDFDIFYNLDRFIEA
jgi:AAA15 family ATPase/GTPase